MTPKEHLIAELKANIKECERFELLASKRGDYTDAIKLVGMADAYKRIIRISESIFKD